MVMMMMPNGGQVHRRVTHYSPDQEILLVGEGDFSFSFSLAMIFGSASNIVATSLDTKCNNGCFTSTVSSSLSFLWGSFSDRLFHYFKNWVLALGFLSIKRFQFIVWMKRHWNSAILCFDLWGFQVCHFLGLILMHANLYMDYFTCSSLDGKDELVKKYKNAESNVATLKRMGAQVYHGVDATQMKSFADLSMRKFDRIIFNFPHAGFHGREDSPKMIREHSKLMQGFFKNAAGMLRPFGEVHVSHKTTEPYCHWKIEELAFGCSLALRECVKFNKVDYPWYSNKRGDGTRSDEPFLLGECSTFKFAVTRYSEFTRMAMNMAMNTRHQNGIPCPRYQLGDSSVPCHNQLHFNHPFSAQDGGAINLRAGIVHEAAGSSFERTMVPTPRTLNQQPLYNEYQQNLRSLWLLLVSLYGQHPQVAARDMNPS